MVVDEAKRLTPLRGTSYAATYMFRFGVPTAVIQRILAEFSTPSARIDQRGASQLPREPATTYDSLNI